MQTRVRHFLPPLYFGDILCMYCQKGIGGFFSSVIREGALQQARCPTPGCGAVPLDVELRALLDDEDYAR